MFPRNVLKRSLRMFPECSHEKFYERSIQMLSERSYGRFQERSLWIFSEYCCGTFSQYFFWTFLERSTGTFREHCFGTLKNPDIFLVLGTFLERSDGTFRTFHRNVHRTFREGIVLWGRLKPGRWISALESTRKIFNWQGSIIYRNDTFLGISQAYEWQIKVSARE